eukprot:TRINITY_DN46901_c0_g1_i1.p1 TRINITY_DN46901_c0_g1~~TRINITY_DN46901_c0_g1_i1.p1  ORF type:complete len:649 (-),score=41.72 TRINITY_DN46901_c0_g1_i1:166-2019(-)
MVVDLAKSASSQLCYLDRGIERFVPRPCLEQNGETVALSSSSSAAVREYEDKLKAIEMQRHGLEKAVIATKLARSERWVQRWWKQEPCLLQRPHGAQDTVFQKVPLVGFRDLEITRAFAREPSLFDTLLREVPWRRGKVMTRDTTTGELVLRFDRTGSTIAASRLVADCPRGIDALDRLLQRAFSKANIRDPQARVVLNLYTDGEQQLNSHRHDFWTCLISLGAPRVLLVDNRPLVMEDGDMVVFGTQMHGVPRMTNVSQGRISLVIFFYPDRDNLERRWLTVLDAANVDAAKRDEDQEIEEGLTFVDDCRSGSVSSSAIPACSELEALRTAVNPATARTRLHWRKSNAELQFMEYPRLPEATVYSAGCGGLRETDLVSSLEERGISHIWDLRPGREGGFLIGRESLKRACRGRLHYKEWQIGTATAGGLVRHVFCTEEGATLIFRLLSEAQNASVCFLGNEAQWRSDDLRMVVGVALATAGANVIHLSMCLEPSHEEQLTSTSVGHPTDFELPTHLRPDALSQKKPQPRQHQSDSSTAIDHHSSKDISLDNANVCSAETDCNIVSLGSNNPTSSSSARCRRWTKNVRHTKDHTDGDYVEEQPVDSEKIRSRWAKST